MRLAVGAPCDAPSSTTAPPAGACVAQRYRAVKVPAFSGTALTVSKTFSIP